MLEIPRAAIGLLELSYLNNTHCYNFIGSTSSCCGLFHTEKESFFLNKRDNIHT